MRLGGRSQEVDEVGDLRYEWKKLLAIANETNSKLNILLEAFSGTHDGCPESSSQQGLLAAYLLGRHGTVRTCGHIDLWHGMAQNGLEWPIEGRKTF